MSGSAKGKIRLVIDSDVANEVDDQFALSYALSRRNKLKIEAITIAPYRVSWQKGLSVRDGAIDSKNEADRLLRLFGFKYSAKNPFVYLGCSGFLSEGYNETNPAVQKIIELANVGDDLYICCLGTLTNVAMALRLAPEIASKIKIVWLGTDNVLLEKFTDANYRKDVLAFNEVVASSVDFTIFPTFLARAFVTSIYEFPRNIKDNDVTRYLASIVNRFVHIEENWGIKIIRLVSPDLLLKEGKVKYPKGRMINCVTSVPKHSYVWKDFLSSVNKIKGGLYKPRVFFVSDTHFGQASRVERNLVPFKSVEEMNKELVRRWNNKVAPNDIVYHLGDFGDYDFVKQLNGKITLITRAQ